MSRQRLRSFLGKRWFLVGLALLIPLGLILGWQLPANSLMPIVTSVPARPVTAVVLFLMAFSLSSSALKASLGRPLPVCWATTVNYAFIPIAGLLLIRLQSSRDYQVGLMIAASVPCTMASCAVWTRKAGGNDAIALLVTMITNGCCFVVTPFWMYMATRQDVGLGFGVMVMRLASAVLLPCLLGQLLRLSGKAAAFATNRKTLFGVIAQSLILVLVFTAACKAGGRFQLDQAGPGIAATVLVLISCIVLHLGGMGVGLLGARLLNVSIADRKAIAFASSQKTLPVGILVADAFGRSAGLSFVVFPMLMYHASQLFIDTFVADAYAKQATVNSRTSDM